MGALCRRRGALVCRPVVGAGGDLHGAPPAVERRRGAMQRDCTHLHPPAFRRLLAASGCSPQPSGSHALTAAARSSPYPSLAFLHSLTGSRHSMLFKRISRGTRAPVLVFFLNKSRNMSNSQAPIVDRSRSSCCRQDLLFEKKANNEVLCSDGRSVAAKITRIGTD